MNHDTTNLFVTSKNETTNSPIHEFKESLFAFLKGSLKAYKTPLFYGAHHGVLFLICYFKKHLRLAFSF